ncbi:uncharacterized protein PFL1_02362 [Pseudozyma flocculosa PF-1]|uniref:Uncharacterized protein n=1 Tax=Pseudozyma flocculosa TaxID=84751 RepID=A0A5C3F5P1_9BASI|nr:uncharacterized protein PFL1_02362 [Pseudozyma flocculosa PF-1]EPQ30246.1 hypothetical protein PFL1_02362 [Pseudozyma flocculosa PF-1]SPO39818.1 uncharacterized protein PSFLO_05299 [Pseudozyma flocculosa]
MYLPLPSIPPTSSLLTSLLTVLHLPFLFPTTDDPRTVASTACTFSVGPPGPSTGLCPAFHHYCAQTAARLLESPDRRRGDEGGREEDRGKWSSGCVGGSGATSVGGFISGYTVSCAVEGLEMVPTVFPDFLQDQLTFEGEEGPEIIPFSFVGCQVSPRHA